ncbi:MAG: GNAT family N-acetyltransferase [Fimbriimonadales bacterium]|nr:GNAT family N-acetyltransferase [Fimbriimonadales bacterium]
MSLTIRAFREEDTAALSRLWSLAFRGGKSREANEPIVEENSVFVADVDGDVVGGFTIEHMDATRGPSVLRCGGVAGVAVLPESRFSGIGGEMMRFALDYMRSEGYLLSSLYPFKEGYYRRFGYEVAGQRFKISMPADRLPELACELRAREASPEDWQKFAAVYRAFASKYSGMWTRSETFWRHLLRDADPTPVRYLIGDPPEAYVVIRNLGDFWGETSASEIAWTSPAGYRSCLGLLKNVGINRGKLTWIEPSDSPFLAQYYDYGAEISLFRPIMFRTIDVPAALRCLQPSAGGEFTFQLEDVSIPDNRGPWKVCFDPSGVRVERSDSAELQLSVGAFTQALLGQPSLDRLAAHGLVSGKSVEAAAKLLTPMPVCCYNFF